MRRLPLLSLAFLVAALATACARSVTLNQDAAETYAVNVVNQMPHAMVVSFDDGTTTRHLGTVAGNRQDRFIVTASRATVTIIATDEADTHTVRRTVTLSAGSTVEVRIN